MLVSAESDLVFSWSVSFALPLRRWEKAHFTDALNLKHKRIIQQLKQLKKRKNIRVTFRTWSRFSVVTSVAMRFFRNAARSTSKTSFLRAYVKQSVWRARSSERARPKRRLRGGDVPAKKNV